MKPYIVGVGFLSLSLLIKFTSITYEMVISNMQQNYENLFMCLDKNSIGWKIYINEF